MTTTALPHFLLALATAPERGVVLAVGRSVSTVEDEVLRPVADHVQVKRPRGGLVEVLGCKVYLHGADDPRSENRLRGMAVDLVYLTDLDYLPDHLVTLCRSRLLRPGGRVVMCQRDRELGSQVWNGAKQSGKSGQFVERQA
ncbi:hypothetical protein JNW90_29380 [Micromonospora sp. STR1s_5]|nr:hypothetical protein [Micromonospora sp. STR1s_5]